MYTPGINDRWIAGCAPSVCTYIFGVEKGVHYIGLGPRPGAGDGRDCPCLLALPSLLWWQIRFKNRRRLWEAHLAGELPKLVDGKAQEGRETGRGAVAYCCCYCL